MLTVKSSSFACSKCLPRSRQWRYFRRRPLFPSTTSRTIATTIRHPTQMEPSPEHTKPDILREFWASLSQDRQSGPDGEYDKELARRQKENVYIYPRVNKYSSEQMRDLLSEVALARKYRSREKLMTTWAKIQRSRSTAAGISRYSDEEYELICAQIIRGFKAMRCPDDAEAVWNELKKTHPKLAQRSWNCILCGCIEAQDFQAVRAVWSTMLASNIIPDIQNYATWLHALSQQGKPREAVDELNRIYLAWINAARSQMQSQAPIKESKQRNIVGKGKHSRGSGTVKSQLILNPKEIGDVAYRRQMDPAGAENLVLWADSIGIKPDNGTFNAMIRLYVQLRQPEKALRVIHHIRKAGFVPDVVLYTTIIDLFFRSKLRGNWDDSSIQIPRILSEMTTNAVPATEQTYTTIVKGLLQNCNNLGAAKEVLEHMSSISMPWSAHVYTVLLDFLIARNPQNVAQLAEWTERLDANPDGVIVDQMLGDRLIHLHAVQGNLHRVTKYLTYARANYHKVRNSTLNLVLDAFDQAGDLVNLKRLVQDIRTDLACRKGISTRYGSREESLDELARRCDGIERQLSLQNGP